MRKYRLTIFFAVTAVVVIAVAAIIVNHVVGNLAEENLIRIAEENTIRDVMHMQGMMRHNTAIHAEHSDGASDGHAMQGVEQTLHLTMESLVGPEGLDRTFPMVSEGLNVVKFDLFDVNGTTVWSTDASTIGITNRESPLLAKAAKGETSSKLVADHDVVDLDGVTRTVDVVETYSPVRDVLGGEIIGAVRADSGFYTHAVVAVCRRMDVRFSIAIRQRARLWNLIEAIPEDASTPIPYWMDAAADVAETTYTPFQAEADAAPVRLIVRRVKPAPRSQLALFATYSYHGFITDRDGETLELEADHRRHAEIENAIRDLKYGVGLNHLPSGRFAANGAWLAVQVMAHNLARWNSPHRPGSADRDHQDPQTTGLCLGRTDHPLGTPIDPASSPALALGGAVQPRPGPTASHSTPSLTAPVRH